MTRPLTAKKNLSAKLNAIQLEIDEIKEEIEIKKLQKHEEAEARKMLRLFST